MPAEAGAAPALHTVGSRVWMADPDGNGWLKAEVSNLGAGGTLTVKLEDGTEKTCTQDEIPLQNPGKNGVEDMTTLSYLNEPGVLWNLKVRYQQDDIYTYTGSILIAVNPFAPMPHIYGPHMMEQYRGVPLGDLSPHVYAIADAAYCQMRRDAKSQSILVSGESGAGKTETSKLIMQYLAWIGGYVGLEGGTRRTVEQQVLESNPLLEAFGNAKTVRNDNSSRFGKFTEIQFNREGRISGAAIRTYLLERSRVVAVNDPERNYHIFYQLCEGASAEERAALRLRPAAEFHYLNQSTCYQLNGVSNAEEYARTRRAMKLVGLPADEQDAVFRTVAAVLHLGNIEFAGSGGDEGSAVAAGSGEEALCSAAHLLGVDTDGLRHALTTRTRQTVDGPIVSPIDVAAAVDNRDSLAKTLYSRLFDWLVARVNSSIGQDSGACTLIGVLDIYGFEQFKENHFEQFCINLANEKLQQHFNQHVFKVEQAEYERETIEWSYIEFVDNQDVVDLIEGRMGILDLLDESCRFPKATHEDFAQKLSSSPAVAKSRRFSKPRLALTDFTVDHYAGAVTYRTDSFLTKNRDFVVAEHQALLGASHHAFVRMLFPAAEEPSPAAAAQLTRTPATGSAPPLQRRYNAATTPLQVPLPRSAPPSRYEFLSAPPATSSGYKFSSVGSQFKRQLAELLEALHTMEPHYIRCIKPNSLNRPMDFEASNVLHQLRCGGVLEAVRISCAGYPTKALYEEFVDHFWPLAVDSMALDDRALTRLIVEQVLGSGNGSSQFGKTKVFLRAGKMAELDRRRTDVLNAAAVVIQRFSRGWMARAQYQTKRRAVIKLQAVVRGMLDRAVSQEMRRQRAAVIIQTAVRRHQAQSRFRAAVRSVLTIQRGFRAYKARVAAQHAREQLAVLLIQSNWRRHQAQADFLQLRRGVIAAQCAWRCKLAKRELRKRRAAARESGKLLQDKQALETRLRDVQNVLRNVQNQRNELRQQLREEKAAREAADARATQAERAAAEQVAAAKADIAEELASQQASRRALEAEVARVRSDLAASGEASAAAQEILAQEAQELRSRVAALERQRVEVEDVARSQVTELMARLNNAVAQRDAAREEALMAGERLRRMQDDVSSGRYAQQTGAVAATGHLLIASTGPGSSGARQLMQARTGSPTRENGTPAPHTVHGGRQFEGPGGEALTEADKRQRELFSKQQQLVKEQRAADHQRLLALLQTDLGFYKGRPVAAVLVFRCCLQWKAFQADRTTLFDDIMRKALGEQVEAHQEDNARLAYWLSNSVTLLFLMQKHIKPASGGSYTARLQQSGRQAAQGLFGSGGKISSFFGGRSAVQGSPGGEASIHGGTAGGLPQVEAKYPALLFKQQLDAFVQRIFPMLRDNVKRVITPHLAPCIHAPRVAHGRTNRRQTQDGPDGAVGSARAAGDPSVLAPWNQILGVFDELLGTLRANHVPPFLVRKLFEQLFSFVDVQLFNQLLLRRECCSFSNGEYVKTGLAEVEVWVGAVGKQWVGDAWEQLAHIRQAVGFLVIHQKAKKRLEEITQDLCPVLSVQQLYRISTMYWDDRYNTETVSHDVLSRMKQLMVESSARSSAGHSFLLDDDTTIPFTQDDIGGVMDERDLLGETPVPPQLQEAQTFAFLGKRLEVALAGAS